MFLREFQLVTPFRIHQIFSSTRAIRCNFFAALLVPDKFAQCSHKQFLCNAAKVRKKIVQQKADSILLQSSATFFLCCISQKKNCATKS